MKDIAKQIVIVQKKHDHLTNDLTKHIIKDILSLAFEDNKLGITNKEKDEYIERMKGVYEDQIYEYRSQQKLNSRQLEIMERVKNGGSGPLGDILKVD